MRNKQRKIVTQWVFIVWGLFAFMILNHLASGNDTILMVGRISLVLAIAVSMFFTSKDMNQIPNRDISLSAQDEVQDLLHKPIVVVYYGLVTAACILIASKAANTGINPFESLGINFIFIGILILFAPLIIWNEQKRYIAAR